MTDFLTILAFTYLCNSSAELRLVSQNEARDCAYAYEQVKQHFHTANEPAPIGTRERIQQNIAAYLAFKNWETENAGLVSRMKADAARQASGALSVSG